MASYEFPASGAFEVPILPADFTGADFAAAQEAFLSATKHLLGAQSTISAIAPVGGVLTPTQPIHYVDTEGSAASDTVSVISGTNFRDGEVLLLLPYNPSHVVTFDISSPQMIMQDTKYFVMDAANKAILFVKNGNTFVEAFRSGWQPLAPHGKEFITASGNWTVPDDVYKIWVTLVGGGGGGGGGAGSSTDGGNGGNGGNTVFGSLTALGGLGGGGGKANGGPGQATGAGQPGCPGDPDGVFTAYGGGAINTVLGQYGRGGQGGAGRDGGGGGASGSIGYIDHILHKKERAVTPGQVVAATIGTGGTAGAAGTGGSGGTAGTAGTDGAVLVEW